MLGFKKKHLTKPWSNHPKENCPKVQSRKLNSLIEILSTIVWNQSNVQTELSVVNPSNFLLLVVKSTLQCCFSHQPSTMHQVIPTMHWLHHYVQPMSGEVRLTLGHKFQWPEWSSACQGTGQMTVSPAWLGKHRATKLHRDFTINGRHQMWEVHCIWTGHYNPTLQCFNEFQGFLGSESKSIGTSPRHFTAGPLSTELNVFNPLRCAMGLPMEHPGGALCAFGCAGSNGFSASGPSLKAEGFWLSPKPEDAPKMSVLPTLRLPFWCCASVPGTLISQGQRLSEIHGWVSVPSENCPSRRSSFRSLRMHSGQLSNEAAASLQVLWTTRRWFEISDLVFSH